MAICFVSFIIVMDQSGVTYQEGFIPSCFVFVTGAIAILATYFNSTSRFREFELKTRLEDTNQKLKAIDETKSRFFANLSHELRTPLTLILGPAENLRASKKIHEDPVLEGHLDTIEENGYRLLRLINDILDLVKLDSGESHPHPETVNVPDFINGITANLRPVATLKGLDISCRCEDVERKVVWVDRDRLDKIMLNLAVNAIKFTPSGGSIVLSADTEGEDLMLAVSDTGEGMSKEDMGNVFVRFWQAGMSARRKHRGAGIGLSLVKSLSESMEGEVSVESEIGKGTTFHVRIPAPKPPEGAESQDANRSSLDVLERFNEKARLALSDKGVRLVANGHGEDLNLVEGVSHVRLEGDKKRVLVADDEEAIRAFIARQLSDYELIQAPDGKDAWALAQACKPDLIILDLMMPGLDGIQVTRKIRQSESLSRVPIILITAQASEAPRLEALDAGVNDFISKPFSGVELGARAKNLLESSEFEVQLSENHERLESAYDQLKEQGSMLVQVEKLSSLGRMSAGIVHEVNNPLNYTKAALHALKTFQASISEDEREDFIDVLNDAQEGVQRVIGIVTDLRSFTRGDTTMMTDLVLEEVIESSRRLCSAELSDIDFELDVSPQLTIRGNERQLCQLFVNFLSNASRAIQVKADNLMRGEIRIRAKKRSAGGVDVSIRDNGCGIDPADVNHIFEPFFTKNDVGEGMGLGLSICHSILKQHNAEASVASELGKYTELKISFPANEQQLQTSSENYEK
ncbi:MAG: response regulator [Verrucomicrobiae bacterium]|nr:response regulator [Verrucomicrobiae bacterium]NNJ42100.1 response regulator [Akkermansiaceae bacterium]